MTTDYFSKNGIKHIDYKDVDILVKFLNPHGRINARRHSGLNAKHQRRMTQDIKRARFMGLIPYIIK